MTIFKSVWNWLTGVAKEVRTALSNGEVIANEIKEVVDSPILSVIVSMTPTGIDNLALDYVRKGLTAFVTVMGWSDKLITDFESDPDAKATVLTALNAKSAVLLADYNNAKLSIQQALTSAPVLYDPEIMQ